MSFSAVKKRPSAADSQGHQRALVDFKKKKRQTESVWTGRAGQVSGKPLTVNRYEETPLSAAKSFRCVITQFWVNSCVPKSVHRGGSHLVPKPDFQSKNGQLIDPVRAAHMRRSASLSIYTYCPQYGVTGRQTAPPTDI